MQDTPPPIGMFATTNGGGGGGGGGGSNPTSFSSPSSPPSPFSNNNVNVNTKYLQVAATCKHLVGYSFEVGNVNGEHVSRHKFQANVTAQELASTLLHPPPIHYPYWHLCNTRRTLRGCRNRRNERATRGPITTLPAPSRGRTLLSHLC